MDKSWLLNPKAIQAAKACIHIVEQELGVKLKLSHPDFLNLLYDYCELTDSEQLIKAFKILISMAGVEVKQELLKNHSETNASSRVTPISKANPDISVDETPSSSERLEQILTQSPKKKSENDTEYISYQGKRYQRWQDEREFKGLYRGQPRYA